MSESTLASYDELPYPRTPFADTHPDNLAAVATLFGLHPAPVDRCRVLELGCAGGGNLLPMAEALPDSRFVGIDLSRRQVEDGRRVAAELGLQNLDLRHLSILDVDEDFGEYDYILCHGVYSWVPPAVREKILAVAARHLAPQGVAYVSYNTYPGCHGRGILRDLLLFHAGSAPTARERVARGRQVLDFLGRIREGPGGRFGGSYWKVLMAEVEPLRHLSDSYLLHEHMEDINQPVLFHEFVARAEAHGLRYLGEAQLGAMAAGNFPPAIEKALRELADDVMQLEQYMDFLRNRSFRQTLLCRREVTPEWSLKPERLGAFSIASSARPVSPTAVLAAPGDESFRTAAGTTITVPDPVLKLALATLSERWPAATPFAELVVTVSSRLQAPAVAYSDLSRALAVHLLRCYMAGLVEFHVHRPEFCRQVRERPLASPLTRLLAREGGPVANRRHEVVPLEPFALQVLACLDGRNDRAAILRVLTSRSDGSPEDGPALGERLEEALRGLAGAALLIG
jgi:methyltransferase-like protein/SAM-dependent methyltransferase